MQDDLVEDKEVDTHEEYEYEYYDEEEEPEK